MIFTSWNRGPKLYSKAIRHFSNEEICIDTIALLRWPDGIPVCPKCGGKEHYYLATKKRWKCKNGKCGNNSPSRPGRSLRIRPRSRQMAHGHMDNCRVQKRR